MTKYIIGSGWWCDHMGRKDPDGNRIGKFILDCNRSPEFSKVWYHFVNKYTSPKKIFIVDSNSPIKPDISNNTDKRIEIVSMKKNFGSARQRQGSLTGGERAFLTGCFYALMNDVDYFVYIEQDCLVRGEGWIDYLLEEMKEKNSCIAFNTWPAGYKAEWCLCVVKTSYILKFINTYIAMAPGISELKFDKIRKNRNINFMKIPFGYGRNRPINFGDKYFYAQQWKKEEYEQILKMEGLEWSN